MGEKWKLMNKRISKCRQAWEYDKQSSSD